MLIIALDKAFVSTIKVWRNKKNIYVDTLLSVRLVIRRLRVRPTLGRQHSFMEIDHAIFSTVIPFG